MIGVSRVTVCTAQMAARRTNKYGRITRERRFTLNAMEDLIDFQHAVPFPRRIDTPTRRRNPDFQSGKPFFKLLE